MADINNFPDITEAQRKSLIKRLLRFRKGIQAARDSNMQTEADENDDLIAQIALAALTAKPVAYTDDEELEDLSKHTFANMFTPREEYKTNPSWRPLFTAPTPPALRLPDVRDGDPGEFQDIKTRQGFKNGFRFALEEVKRLNSQDETTEAKDE